MFLYFICVILCIIEYFLFAETLNASQSTFIQEHVVQSRQGRTVSAKERPVAGMCSILLILFVIYFLT